MEDMFKSLFQPLQIGSMRLKNRIVMPPMGTNFANPEKPGFVSERHKSYYGERAKGGTALIIIEAFNVNPTRRARKLGLALFDDRFIPSIRELTELIHENGAKCAIQLSHHGRIGAMKVDCYGNLDSSTLQPDHYFAASPLPHPTLGVIAREFSHSQLEEIAGYFADTAERAEKVGVDVVELHGAHGIILNEFLSPYSNHRTDQYGGDIVRRSRFPLEVVGRVRQRLTDKVVLSYRMSAVEFVNGGLSIEESVFFAKELEAAGVQIIHVSAGLNQTLLDMNNVIPPMSFPRGRLIQYAEQIKKAVKIPVIVVQRINTPELADDIIRTGKADLVATGRPLIADPYWPLKAQEGHPEDIRRCIACNQGCMEKIVMEQPLTCLYNPEVGYENKYRIKKKAKKAKKALVVGGGVAGMEAACVLAEKGYSVKLIEREERLGGKARAAAILSEKEEFNGVTEYLQNQLKKLNVEIKLNEQVRIHEIKETDFDEIIIALGSIPVIPKMNLHDKSKVRMATDVLEHPEDVGEEVVILGGGMVAIEVAEFFYHMGKKIIIIEMKNRICDDIGPLNRANVMDRVNRSTMDIMLNTKIIELNDGGIFILKDGKESLIPASGTIVLAMGARPSVESTQRNGQHIHFIGDCKKVGNAMDAIHDAFNTCVEL